MFPKLSFIPNNLNNLRRIQWLRPSELRQLQERKLHTLLKHAYDKVVYYRNLLKSVGLKPEDIKTLDDLSRVPLTSRFQLQALAPEKIIAKGTDLSHCKNLRTSGSSGRPLDVFVSSQEARLRDKYLVFLAVENGYKITDKVLSVSHPNHIVKKDKRIPLLRALGFGRSRQISLFEDPGAFLEKLLKFKPNILKGFPSSLKKLASEIEKNRIKLTSPKVVLCFGEWISREDREFISSVFQAEVIDCYSANECGFIGWECREHLGYHMQCDNVIVELMKQDGTKSGEGEEGEVVITSLNSFTMPFIRYRLGDLVVLSDTRCPCGRGLPLIKILTGRLNDHVISLDGKLISPFVLMNAMRDISGIAQYQIIQTREKNFCINILKDGKFSLGTIPKIQNNLTQILGDNVSIDCKILEEINIDKFGKFRSVISNIPK